MRLKAFDNPEALFQELKKKERKILKEGTIIAVIVCLIVCIVHSIMGWLFVQAILICVIVIFASILISTFYSSIISKQYKIRIIDKLIHRFELGMIYHDSLENDEVIGKIFRIPSKIKTHIEDHLEWEKNGLKFEMENVYIGRQLDDDSIYTGHIVKIPMNFDKSLIVKKRSDKYMRVYSSKLAVCEENHEFLKSHEMLSDFKIDIFFINEVENLVKKYHNEISLVFRDKMCYVINLNKSLLFSTLGESSIKIMEDIIYEDLRLIEDILNLSFNKKVL